MMIDAISFLFSQFVIGSFSSFAFIAGNRWRRPRRRDLTRIDIFIKYFIYH